MGSSVENKKGLNREELERKVNSLYRDVALQPKGAFPFETGRSLAERLGYPPGMVDRIPSEALESFAGVGYFFHLAEIRPGERVIDLGCGAGMDAYIAAQYTGNNGKVLGIDITEDLLEKARSWQLRYPSYQMLFHPANMERIPVADEAVDMVISNGAVNLAIDKEAVFREVARVLRPGGRLVMAEMVSSEDLPVKIKTDTTLWAAGIGAVVSQEQFISLLEHAGLKMVIVEDNPQYTFVSEKARNLSQEYGIRSISLLAIKK